MLGFILYQKECDFVFWNKMIVPQVLKSWVSKK